MTDTASNPTLDQLLAQHRQSTDALSAALAAEGPKGIYARVSDILARPAFAEAIRDLEPLVKGLPDSDQIGKGVGSLLVLNASLPHLIRMALAPQQAAEPA